MISAARRVANRIAQQRLRERIKNCEATYHLAAGPAVLDMLVRRKYLEDSETENDLEVGAAIALFLRDHAEARRAVEGALWPCRVQCSYHVCHGTKTSECNVSTSNGNEGRNHKKPDC
jgi:hypothetical protein